MNQAIIQAIMDWNPWLEHAFPEQLLGCARQYDVLGYVTLEEIKILTGARRVGKSTLLYHVIKKLLEQTKDILYINFQDEVLQNHTLSDVYYQYLERGKVTHLFVDEIQYCKDWVSFVRKLYDRKELKQIWITGSNASLIKQEYAELLTGRNISIAISTLSFREYLEFKKIESTTLPFSMKQQAVVKKHFSIYLEYGGFPAVVLRELYQRELLQNYFEDFIYKDIASRYDVNVTKVKELGIYLASNIAKIYSYRKIAAALHIHANTVLDYLSYFKETFLFDELYKFDYSLKAQYQHDKKIYMVDTGMAAAISFEFSEDTGRVLENTVFNELRRRHQEICFHKQKNECDFIIKSDLDVTQAIQVCVSIQQAETANREVNGLIEALECYGLKEGLILTMDEEETRYIEGKNGTYTVQIVPVWKWMLLT